MGKYLKLEDKTKIEIEISEKELGISSRATLDGEMIKKINEAVGDSVLPIEEIFGEMLNQISYKGEGLLPEKATVNFTISSEEGEVFATAQILGGAVNGMYEDNINGMTWCFDQIIEAKRDGK